MKKTFVQPYIQAIVFAQQDIITTSGDTTVKMTVGSGDGPASPTTQTFNKNPYTGIFPD